MTSERIYRELGGIDPALIAQAAPGEKIAKKRHKWIKWVATAACFCVAAMTSLAFYDFSSAVSLSSVSEGDVSSESRKEGLPEGPYVITSLDWQVYESGEALVEAADLVFIGKVIAIDFKVLDLKTALPATEETRDTDRCLYTVYTVEVSEAYKGDVSHIVNVRVMGGMVDYHVERQLAVMAEGNAYGKESGIPVLEGYRNVQCGIGGFYLFVLRQFETGDPTILNTAQSIFDLRDPAKQQSVGGKSPLISAEDVILEIGIIEWNAFRKKWEQGVYTP